MVSGRAPERNSRTVPADAEAAGIGGSVPRRGLMSRAYAGVSTAVVSYVVNDGPPQGRTGDCCPGTSRDRGA